MQNTTPLTHHEMLALVEPFARAGRSVDMAASDRAARLIVFKPREVLVSLPDAVALSERIELDGRYADHYILDRVLTHPDGRGARLRAAGPEPEVLLAQVEAVAPAQHFGSGPGYTIVRHHEVAAAADKRDRLSATMSVPLRLTRGEVHVEGLHFDMALKLPQLRNVAGEITLTPAPGARPELPEDFLAVQGWDWARLVPDKEGWTSRLRLRGPVLRRSRTAEAALERVARHLVRAFAQTPPQFHRRFLFARFGVMGRRAIPSLTAIGMIVIALLLPRFTSAAQSGLWMALHYVPVALLAVAFSLQELARFEIPPWPRALRGDGWRPAGAGSRTGYAGAGEASRSSAA